MEIDNEDANSTTSDKKLPAAGAEWKEVVGNTKHRLFKEAIDTPLPASPDRTPAIPDTPRTVVPLPPTPAALATPGQSGLFVHLNDGTLRVTVKWMKKNGIMMQRIQFTTSWRRYRMRLCSHG